MISKAKFYIDKLGLTTHPEGGYFKEVYRSAETIDNAHLPDRYTGERNFSTSIYFLLEGEQTSSFHKLASDELWHFYDGCGVKIFIIEKNGELSVVTLGKDIESNMRLQCVIPAGCWFGAEIVDKKSFALVGCTVAPGFDFNDFVLSKIDELVRAYPQHTLLIDRLNRKKTFK